MFLQLGSTGSEHYTFCMCNPPFFEDTDNMTGLSRSPNRAAPKSVCTATPVGMYYFLLCLIVTLLFLR